MLTVFLKRFFVITSITLLFVGCKNNEQVDSKVVAQKVAVNKIVPQMLSEILDYSGTIEPDNSVALAFSVAGRITAINVQEGQYVRKGQLLAAVETITYQNAFDIAKAGYEQALDNFNRLNELYKKGSLPERDFIAVKSGLTQATANKNIAKKNLIDTKLFAPFSGIITRKITEVGAIVAPGVPAFNLIKTDLVYATASVGENEISSLSVNDDVLVKIPVLDKNIKGKVTIINPQADNFSKTYLIKIRLKNTDGKLMPGMNANIEINTGINKDVIAIPAKSIVKDLNDISYVFIATKNNIAFKKRITISKIIGVDKVIVTSGLSKGDNLIIAGQTKLEDGSPIQF